jgi:metal-dependent amidase/aminoacylase/carboxypeptidase family protein
VTGRPDANWDEVVDAAVALRRRLHQRPELRWEETETANEYRVDV